MTTTDTQKRTASVKRLTTENQRLRAELTELRKTTRNRIRELEQVIKAFDIDDFEAARAEVVALRAELAEVRRKAREL